MTYPLLLSVLSRTRIIHRQIARARSQATDEERPRRHNNAFGRGAAESMRELMTIAAARNVSA